jgi:hypothetical protein
MAFAPPPEPDVARIQRWCRAKVPDRVRDEVRIECEVSGRDVTIVERRPPWGPDAGPEWMDNEVALLRYLKSRGVWRLYWPGSDEHWHAYSDLPFARTVGELLEEIDRDPTALFWG